MFIQISHPHCWSWQRAQSSRRTKTVILRVISIVKQGVFFIFRNTVVSLENINYNDFNKNSTYFHPHMLIVKCPIFIFYWFKIATPLLGLYKTFLWIYFTTSIAICICFLVVWDKITILANNMRYITFYFIMTFQYYNKNISFILFQHHVQFPLKQKQLTE